MRCGFPIRSVLVALALAALTCAPTAAQRMRTRVVSAPPGTRVITTSPSGSTSNGVPVAVTNPAGVVSGNSVERLLNGSYPAPGLGFDFTHHAAVNRNLGVRALIDPVTQHRLALERRIRRETPVAVAPAFPVVVNSIQINVVPQPPVVIIQEPEPPPAQYIEQASYRERSRRAVPRDAVEDAAPEPPPYFYEPQREADELVFIRRDGSLLFAVAFTTRPAAAAEGARIVYITREGHRRSVALSELDLDATREMNEARGTTLHL